MKKRRDPSPEFDLFLPIMGDLPLKDQRETMERPFFSLQKRKRVKPIEYTSPDGATWVKIEAIPAYGMATIWDADIIIWATSALNRMREQGINDRSEEQHQRTRLSRPSGRPTAVADDVHFHVDPRPQASQQGGLQLARQMDVGGRSRNRPASRHDHHTVGLGL